MVTNWLYYNKMEFFVKGVAPYKKTAKVFAVLFKSLLMLREKV